MHRPQAALPPPCRGDGVALVVPECTLHAQCGNQQLCPEIKPRDRRGGCIVRSVLLSVSVCTAQPFAPSDVQVMCKGRARDLQVMCKCKGHARDVQVMCDGRAKDVQVVCK